MFDSCAISLGSFADLLGAISRDPATLSWLGAEASRKAVPNEGFVRPLMETFTLGLGGFTDADVREAARACTGWFVLRGQLRYIARSMMMASNASWAERSLRQRGCRANRAGKARHVPAAGAKLYRWLIDEMDEPDPALIAPLAESFAGDYSVSRLVETMLRSNLFFSQGAYRRRIKSPVEFAVGIVKAMEQVVSTTHLAEDTADLGQDLCHPPTVKGWPGGPCWINAATMVERHNLSQSLLQGSEPYGDKLDPWAVAQRHGCETPESAARFLLDLFLQGDIEPDDREALVESVRTAATSGGESKATLRALAHAVVTLPEFHLA